LVLNHIGKPDIRRRQWDDWVDMMVEAAKRPNLMVKLSGMIVEADRDHWQPADLKPYVDKTIELFGIDRVMYGSNWPVCLLAASYAEVFHALEERLEGLAESEKAKVWGENARRFYNIT
jgi:L-fuconolactonase